MRRVKTQVLIRCSANLAKGMASGGFQLPPPGAFSWEYEQTMQLRTQHKEPKNTGPVLVLILAGIGIVYGGYYRSTVLEHAVVGPPKTPTAQTVKHLSTNTNDAAKLTETIKGLLND